MMMSTERIIVAIEPGSVNSQKLNRLKEFLFRKGLNRSADNQNVYVRETDDPENYRNRIEEVFQEFPEVKFEILNYTS